MYHVQYINLGIVVGRVGMPDFNKLGRKDLAERGAYRLSWLAAEEYGLFDRVEQTVIVPVAMIREFLDEMDGRRDTTKS